MKLKDAGTAGDRLLAVVEYRKLGSKSALAEVLGVTSGAIYTAIKRGKITKQMALSVQGALGISAEWLLNGDEPMEAQVDLSLDFKMKLEMLSRIKGLNRQIPETLTSIWFSRAVTNQEHAFHALAWKVLGSDVFHKQMGNWAFSIQLKDSERFSDYSQKFSKYESNYVEVSRFLWNVAESRADPVPWNQDLFDDDLNSALQTRVFADLKDQKYLDQWTKETEHLSDEKRTALLAAYGYACNLRSEAENEFLPSEFGRDYAEGMLFNEDPYAIDFASNLTEVSIDELWYGNISPAELYRQIRKAG